LAKLEVKKTFGQTLVESISDLKELDHRLMNAIDTKYLRKFLIDISAMIEDFVRALDTKNQATDGHLEAAYNRLYL